MHLIPHIKHLYLASQQVIPKCVSLLTAAMVSCARIEDLWRAAEAFEPNLLRTSPDRAHRVDAVFSIVGDDDDEDDDLNDKENNAVLCSGDRGSGAGGASIDLSALTCVRGRARVLRDVSLRARGPNLVVVTGLNASGKTSLLLAIARELDIESGTVRCRPADVRIALCAHEAWLLDASVRDNVALAFTNGNVSAACATAMHSAALERDLAEWPHGADTVLGEKGVCASGAQMFY